MQSDLRGRDLIGDLDFSKEEVETILDVAWDLKRKRALGESHAYLRDKVLAMLFFFSSTRTRGSFEAGMAQLGGHAAFIESRTTQISHGDTEKEMGDLCKKRGGATAYMGTSDMLEVEKMEDAGDEMAKLINEAMAYGVVKEVGAMSAVLAGEVDAIYITGSMAYNKKFVKYIIDRVSWIVGGEDKVLV